MGALNFNASIAKRAASNAAARCGALTTAMTELSPSAKLPVR
jgi:hypothetical protein